MQQEGLPLYEGSALEDLATLPLGDWERRGGKVAYTRLGDQEHYSLQIVEIPPKGELKPERHMYDSVMFVMNRYSYSMQNFFSNQGTRWNLRAYETNFIPDIRNFELDPYP